MNMKMKAGVSAARAAALLALSMGALSAPAHAADGQKEAPGRCYGANSCKGKSLCATANNDCKGLNDCKGKGVIVATPSACKAAGGTTTEAEHK
jgi:hypothetical protein